MPRRSPRWRPPPPKILSTSTSLVLVECYAAEGKAYIFRPLIGEPADVILLGRNGEVISRRGVGEVEVSWATESLPPGEWRVLGWRLPSGELRHGDHDRVDPALAAWDALPVPNRPAPWRWISGGPVPGKE